MTADPRFSLSPMPVVLVRGVRALQVQRVCLSHNFEVILKIWTVRVVSGYENVRIENMSTSFRDGLAFCAILHHFRPHLLDYSSLEPQNVLYNNTLAFSVAERELGIPSLLEPQVSATSMSRSTG